MVIFFIVMLVNSVASIPTPLVNQTVARKDTQRPKLIEIKFPFKLGAMDNVFAWVKNTMQSMASKIDITLPDQQTKDSKMGAKKVEKVSESLRNNVLDIKEKIAMPRNSFVELETEPLSSWTKAVPEIFAPLLNAEAFLPLYFGDSYADKFRSQDYSKYKYNVDTKNPGTRGKGLMRESSSEEKSAALKDGEKHLDSVESSSEIVSEPKNINATGIPAGPTPIPFAIPFEAFITITRETSHEPPVSAEANKTTPSPASTTKSPVIFQRVVSCNHSQSFTEPRPYSPKTPRDYETPPYVDERRQFNSGKLDFYNPNTPDNYEQNIPYVDERRKPISEKGSKTEVPKRKKKKDSSRKRQITALGDLLEALGLIKKSNKSTRVQESATTSSAVTRPSQQSREPPRRPSFEFEDVSIKLCGQLEYS